MFKRVSRKYSFSILTFIIFISVLIYLISKNLPETIFITAIVSTNLSILIVAVSYLTGQAKIDVRAVYGNSKMDKES